MARDNRLDGMAGCKWRAVGAANLKTTPLPLVSAPLRRSPSCFLGAVNSGLIGLEALDSWKRSFLGQLDWMSSGYRMMIALRWVVEWHHRSTDTYHLPAQCSLSISLNDQMDYLSSSRSGCFPTESGSSEPFPNSDSMHLSG